MVDGEAERAADAYLAMRSPACHACGREFRLAADHNHETGMFRGWLCLGCNTAEGNVGGLDGLRKLVLYLEQHEKPKQTG